MISIETLEKLAKQYQTGLFPNIVREYFQHTFLAELYKLPEAEKMLFKAELHSVSYTEVRVFRRFRFSLFRTPQHEIKSLVESLFVKVLAEIEQVGIKVEIGKNQMLQVEDILELLHSKFLNTSRLELKSIYLVAMEENLSLK